jgi:hypothetical protein
MQDDDQPSSHISQRGSRSQHSTVQPKGSDSELGSASDLSDLEDEHNDLQADAHQEPSQFSSQLMVSYLSMHKLLAVGSAAHWHRMHGIDTSTWPACFVPHHATLMFRSIRVKC